LLFHWNKEQTTDERQRREAGVQESRVGAVPHVAQKKKCCLKQRIDLGEEMT